MLEQFTPTDNLDAKPVRRTFTAEYKARILAEYKAAPDAATRGAILRREKLYGSHLLDWRKARDAGRRPRATPDAIRLHAGHENHPLRPTELEDRPCGSGYSPAAIRY